MTAGIRHATTGPIRDERVHAVLADGFLPITLPLEGGSERSQKGR